jgi:hypothetical protein
LTVWGKRRDLDTKIPEGWKIGELQRLNWVGWRPCHKVMRKRKWSDIHGNQLRSGLNLRGPGELAVGTGSGSRFTGMLVAMPSWHRMTRLKGAPSEALRVRKRQGGHQKDQDAGRSGH